MATVAATIDIHATPAQVLAVLADLEHYPDWSSVHRSAEACDRYPDGRPRRAKMTVAAVGLSDEQTLDYEWSDSGVTWSLVHSIQQRRQQGSYSVRRGRDGLCHVRYELSIDPAIPMPGFIVRRVMKSAVDAATAGLKDRVESLRLEVKPVRTRSREPKKSS